MCQLCAWHVLSYDWSISVHRLCGWHVVRGDDGHKCCCMCELYARHVLVIGGSYGCRHVLGLCGWHIIDGRWGQCEHDMQFLFGWDVVRCWIVSMHRLCGWHVVVSDASDKHSSMCELCAWHILVVGWGRRRRHMLDLCGWHCLKPCGSFSVLLLSTMQCRYVVRCWIISVHKLCGWHVVAILRCHKLSNMCKLCCWYLLVISGSHVNSHMSQLCWRQGFGCLRRCQLIGLCQLHRWNVGWRRLVSLQELCGWDVVRCRIAGVHRLCGWHMVISDAGD